MGSGSPAATSSSAVVVTRHTPSIGVGAAANSLAPAGQTSDWGGADVRSFTSADLVEEGAT